MKYFIGGLGDLILSLDHIRELSDRELLVGSHCYKIMEMFVDLNIHNKVLTYQVYDNINTFHSLWGYDLKHEIGWTRYPNLDYDIDASCSYHLFVSDYILDQGKTILGIHPFGSNFSNEYYAERNIPSKNINIDNLKCLELYNMHINNTILLFGSRQEYDNIFQKDTSLATYLLEHTIVIPYAFDDKLSTSIFLSRYVDEFICTDSVVKTIAAARRKPSKIILNNNIVDSFRDGKFLNYPSMMKYWYNSEEEKSTVFKSILECHI